MAIFLNGSVFFEALNLDQIISEVDQNGMYKREVSLRHVIQDLKLKFNFLDFWGSFENCQIKGTVGDGNDGLFDDLWKQNWWQLDPTLEQAYEEGWIDVISNHLTVSRKSSFVKA